MKCHHCFSKNLNIIKSELKGNIANKRGLLIYASCMDCKKDNAFIFVINEDSHIINVDAEEYWIKLWLNREEL